VKNAKNIHYRSSWELGWYQYLENRENQEKVKSYQAEPMAIPYVFKGAIHRYHPDILIEYVDGTKELLEIRPDRMRSDPKSLAKFEAARKWCSEHERTVFRVVGQAV
jgi:hypothetical protein